MSSSGVHFDDFGFSVLAQDRPEHPDRNRDPCEASAIRGGVSLNALENGVPPALVIALEKIAHADHADDVILPVLIDVNDGKMPDMMLAHDLGSALELVDRNRDHRMSHDAGDAQIPVPAMLDLVDLVEQVALSENADQIVRLHFADDEQRAHFVVAHLANRVADRHIGRNDDRAWRA